MAALDYTDKAAMITFVTGRVDGADASEVEALLVESAADDCAETPVTTYRPYWVVANLLQARLEMVERAGSAAGSSIRYRDPVAAYRALMQRQAALDASLCNIPAGFEAVIAGGLASRSLTRAYE